jgi:hypothetical protein
MDAATTPFLRKGYAGTSMDEIAALAGVGDQRAGVAMLADAVWQQIACTPMRTRSAPRGSLPGPPPDGFMPLADYFGGATFGPSCSR